MSAENLWGEIPLNSELVTPASILREQAQALRDASKGILGGRVDQTSSSDDIHLEFSIVALMLNGYQYQVCYVTHDITLYPLLIADASTGKQYKCGDQGSFKKALAEIFQQAKVKNVIASLIAQSKK